jgi:hypothetical protein
MKSSGAGESALSFKCKLAHQEVGLSGTTLCPALAAYLGIILPGGDLCITEQ